MDRNSLVVLAEEQPETEQQRKIATVSEGEAAQVLQDVVVVLRRGDGCAVRAGRVSHDFHTEGLVSYEPSPGTVFYVGYTRQMRDLDPQLFRLRDLRTTEDGLFVKVSYRFRF